MGLICKQTTYNLMAQHQGFINQCKCNKCADLRAILNRMIYDYSKMAPYKYNSIYNVCACVRLFLIACQHEQHAILRLTIYLYYSHKSYDDLYIYIYMERDVFFPHHISNFHLWSTTSVGGSAGWSHIFFGVPHKEGQRPFNSQLAPLCWAINHG